MRYNMKAHFKVISIILIFSFTLSGCIKKDTDSTKKTDNKAPFNISIMTTAFTSNPAPNESIIVKLLEEYTNTKLDLKWVNNSSYNDNLNIALASGTLPNVVLIPSKSASVITAFRSGTFWELKNYLSNYSNLRSANQSVLNNISIDGKLFGIPRMRTLGRYGIVYRKDWLENTGLSAPKTIDEFYNMMKAFTNSDPDGNGKKDTYGLILSMTDEPLDIIQTWFGVPNTWGEDSSGRLIPAHMTPEYKESLDFIRKMYSEKLINQDFTLLDPSRWNDPFVNGEGGCIVDVLDRANTLESRIERVSDANKVIDVAGAVSGKIGPRSLSTSGNAGFYAISKSSVKNVDELKKVLDFMDKLNEKKIQDLLYYGIEGRHYIVQDGKAIRRTAEGVSETERNDLSMLLTFIPQDRTTPVATTPLREKIMILQNENEKVLVSNLAEPFTSDTYTEKGNVLDDILNSARIKYITGDINENGLNDMLKLWLTSGGNDYIKEVNDEYLKSKSKK